LMLCPTTLLSMVDASVGGKTAIDYKGTKNTLGSFYPASSIIICLETLKTLSDDMYMCGMGEVVKHAFLSDTEELYNFLHSQRDKILARDLETMEKMVRLSLEVKKSYVERDPMETKGIRSALNLGHTFGHALESISSYGISHGEAVVWGMKKALTAGLFLGVTPQDFYLWAIDLISLYPFKADFKVKRSEGEAFLAATKKDKKKSNGTTKFVLMKGLGEPFLTPLSDEQVSVIAL
ncbi:MAG: 3-dehydroquinate synthase, partial [Spirochaetales bacterium]|nr:3-dehydroquinate synthase [Candidatus Physcosoma equi]